MGTKIFSGESYDETLDKDRLMTQLNKVYQLMKDQQWRTLEEIAATVHAPITSIGSRLRDLRQAKFGGHTVNRRRRGDKSKGLFEYQLIENPTWGKEK